MTWPNPMTPGATPARRPGPTPAAIVAAAAGTIMVLGSAFAWITIDVLDASYTAWTTDFGFFPVATFVPLAGLVTAAVVGARFLLGDRFPGDPAAVAYGQLALAVAALLLALGYLFMEREGAELGAGYWLNLFGAMGLLTAAVLELLARRSAGPRPPAGFGAPGFDLPGSPAYDAQAPFGRPDGPPPPGAQWRPPESSPPPGGAAGGPPPPP